MWEPSILIDIHEPLLNKIVHLKKAGLPKTHSTEEEGIQKTTEDRDCGKEDENSKKIQMSHATKALFTRHKLTRVRPGLKLTWVSFCRVNTANPGSTQVSLSCKHY